MDVAEMERWLDILDAAANAQLSLLSSTVGTAAWEEKEAKAEGSDREAKAEGSDRMAAE